MGFARATVVGTLFMYHMLLVCIVLVHGTCHCGGSRGSLCPGLWCFLERSGCCSSSSPATWSCFVAWLCHVPPTTWCGLLRKTRGVVPSSLMSRLSCWFDAACRSFAGQGVYSILAAADSASRCLCFVFLGLLRKLKQWLPRGKVFRRCFHETSLFFVQR